jgi:hypothetical protein
MVLVLKLISIAMARQDYVRSKRKKQVGGWAVEKWGRAQGRKCEEEAGG